MIIIHYTVDYIVSVVYHLDVLRRHITDSLVQALSDTPVVLVNGARQTGKTTLVQSTDPPLSERRYLTFDDPSILAAARGDPSGFVSTLTTPVTLDEVQHVPEIFPAIKLAVDHKREPGRFLLTGSAGVLLLPKLSESLAGRIEVLTLWPFSQGEILGVRERFIDALFSRQPSWRPGRSPALSRNQLLEAVIAGGYPPLSARRQAARRKAWFQSYLMTILQRDVREIANIADLTAVPQLLSIIASRAGGLLNFADLARSLSLPQTTLKRYFALLETTFLVQLLRPWSVNVGQRVIRTPKVYVNDTGLLSHLLGLTRERLEFDRGLAGPALENFVVMEVRKQSSWSETQPQLYYWRTASGREVDIVLEDSAGHLVGIEIKASSTLQREDLRGLQVLADVARKRWVRGIVLYTGTEIVPFASNLSGIPVSSLWTTG